MTRQQRSQGQQDLPLDEQNLQTLVEAIPAFLWRATPDGHIDYVNKRLLAYLGSPLEEIIGWGWMDKVHPDDVAFKVRSWLSNLEAMTSHDANCRFQGADGRYRWFNVRGEPLRDADGCVQKWFGVLIDIDDRKKAEETSRESELKLREIIETMPSTLWSTAADGEPHAVEGRPTSNDHDRVRNALTNPAQLQATLQATLNVIPAYTWSAPPSGGLTFVNKRTANYLGLPKDHPLRFGVDFGAQWDAHVSLVHPDDREETRKVWSTCLRTGEAGEVSFRVRNAQGDYRWFLSRAEPLRASDGALLLWVGVNLDIEELKCAEQALRESELKLREIIETLPSMIWSTGPDGEPTYVNQRVIDYSGCRFEDLLNLGWRDFIHPDDFPETVKAFYHSIQTGESYEAVHRLHRADGQYRWHHARGEPLRDKQQRIIQWYALSVDIDAGKQAENELRATQAQLARASQAATVAELSASIAHEINQPLAGIIASAQTCQTWLSGDNPNLPRARAAVDRIIRDGNAAADIIRRIRALFRQTAPAKTLLQINEVIDEVRRLAQDELNRRGVSMELELTEALPAAPVDRIQIQQVLMNLIRNGAEAMEDANSPAKRLIVRSQRVDECIVVEVCDCGPGLTHPEKIFEPFYSTKPNGLGVGLAISRSIVQAHGGVLRVRSNQPQGTVFSLTLPLPEVRDDAKI
jgi:PAS domain S-box-containing protein